MAAASVSGAVATSMGGGQGQGFDAGNDFGAFATKLAASTVSGWTSMAINANNTEMSRSTLGGLFEASLGNAIGDTITGSAARAEREQQQRDQLYGLSSGNGEPGLTVSSSASQAFSQSVDNGLADRVWSRQETAAYDRGDYVPGGGGVVGAELPGMGGASAGRRLDSLFPDPYVIASGRTSQGLAYDDWSSGARTTEVRQPNIEVTALEPLAVEGNGLRYGLPSGVSLPTFGEALRQGWDREGWSVLQGDRPIAYDLASTTRTFLGAITGYDSTNAARSSFAQGDYVKGTLQTMQAFGEAGTTVLSFGAGSAASGLRAGSMSASEMAAVRATYATEAEVAGGALGNVEGPSFARYLNNVTNPEMRASMLEQASGLRVELLADLQGKGNLAVARLDVPGLPDTMKAYSRFDSGEMGYVSLPSGPQVFEPLAVDKYGAVNTTGSFLRDVDGEFKILETTAQTLGDNPAASGRIDLFTELKACTSCGGTIVQFRARYPNIQLNVFTGK